jgi:ABC-type transport system involved in cytochrome c biogenesis permease subunit
MVSFALTAATCCLVCVFSLAVSPLSLAAESSSDPLAAWRAIPVLEDGRIMPLDTFARRRVETITNAQRPSLGSPESDVPRRWNADELLLEWLARPQAWEDVPLLIAEHEELRELLDLPVFEDGPDGRRRLKHASPADVAESGPLRDRLVQIDERRRRAEAAGDEFRLEGVDAKVEQLWRGYVTYRQLSFRSSDDAIGRTRFASLFETLVGGWRPLQNAIAEAESAAAAESGLGLAPPTDELTTSGSEGDSGAIAACDAVNAGLLAVLEAMGESTRFPTADVLPGMLQAARAVRDLEEKVAAGGFSASLVRQSRQFAERTMVLAESLFDNGGSPAVVPALHAGALETERDADQDLPPWLGLTVLLDAPAELLPGYDETDLANAREAFSDMQAAVQQGSSESTANSLSEAAGRLAAALRQIGTSVEEARRSLPVERLDADLLAWTAYPPEGSTRREVSYNTTDPFRNSWVLSLAAMAGFALAFGRARGPMFWSGVGLLVAELVWTAWAFSQRIAITGWAPVTNMYETVIYVPFFLSLLGLWFLLSPICAAGVAAAWKATALPPPAGRFLPGEQGGPAYAQWLLLLPRLAVSAGVVWILTLAPYAAGDRTIINLLPQTDVESSIPNLNNLVVWIVGLSVLIPTVWFLPRAVLGSVVSLLTIPASWGRGVLASRLADVYERRSFGLVVTAVAFAGTFIAWFFPIPGKQFSPLQPVLRDNFWLTIHVLTIVSSYAAGALAWGLGCLSLGYYLFGRYRDGRSGRKAPLATVALAGFIYKAMQVAVLLLAAGTILGGLWADVSWGRFWGWDPKEVWALVSLLAYIIILHGRYIGWIGDFGLAAGSVLGAAVIGMSWYGVNFLLGAGLHSYGFGQGGQTEFFSFLILNLLLMAAAGWRLRAETGSLVDALDGGDRSAAPQPPPANMSANVPSA